MKIINTSLISFHYQAVVPPNQTFGDVDGYTGAFRFRFWRYGKTVEVWCKWGIYRDLLLEQIIFTHRWSSMTICPSQMRTNYYLLQARRRGRYGPVSWKRLMQSCKVCEKCLWLWKLKHLCLLIEGSYFHLNGGFSTSAMVDLSGGFPEVKYKIMKYSMWNVRVIF